MRKMRFLNKKEIKEIIELLEKQWGFSGELNYEFVSGENNKIYLVTKDVNRVDFSKLRVNAVGLYFGEISKGEIRLSIEGSQIIGDMCSKNVIEIDDINARKWLKGEDIEVNSDKNGFVIVRNKNDFMGCGKLKNFKILNFIPKIRRINASD